MHEKKIESGYGGNVINRLFVDLKQSFHNMGLSPRNLWYLKQFYLEFKNRDSQRPDFTWSHYRLLLSVKNETYKSVFKRLKRSSSDKSNQKQEDVEKKLLAILADK